MGSIDAKQIMAIIAVAVLMLVARGISHAIAKMSKDPSTTDSGRVDLDTIKQILMAIIIAAITAIITANTEMPWFLKTDSDEQPSPTVIVLSKEPSPSSSTLSFPIQATPVHNDEPSLPPSPTTTPIVLLEGSTLISGRIGYEGQIDAYLFTASSTGRYGFVSTCADGTEVITSVKGKLGNTIAQDALLTVAELEAGKEYQIEVIYKEGFTDYEVEIFASQSDQVISLDEGGHGEFFFDSQCDKFKFTSSEEGWYVAISSLKKARVYFCDEHDAILDEGDHRSRFYLDANTTYYIHVESKNGMLGPYVVSIDFWGEKWPVYL